MVPAGVTTPAPESVQLSGVVGAASSPAATSLPTSTLMVTVVFITPAASALAMRLLAPSAAVTLMDASLPLTMKACTVVA